MAVTLFGPRHQVLGLPVCPTRYFTAEPFCLAQPELFLWLTQRTGGICSSVRTILTALPETRQVKRA